AGPDGGRDRVRRPTGSGHGAAVRPRRVGGRRRSRRRRGLVGRQQLRQGLSPPRRGGEGPSTGTTGGRAFRIGWVGPRGARKRWGSAFELLGLEVGIESLAAQELLVSALLD